MKRIITQKDLAANPILKELGIKLGWVVSVTKDEVSLGKSANEQQSNEGDEGQDDGGIEVPKKPPPPQP